MLGAVGWFIDSNRISHDQLEKNCPPEAQIAVGPKNMNDQLALHNIPRYTYYHLSNNVQTMFRLLMLRIIYIYHACTDPICFFLADHMPTRPVAGHVRQKPWDSGMSMGYTPNVAMSYH